MFRSRNVAAIFCALTVISLVTVNGAKAQSTQPQFQESIRSMTPKQLSDVMNSMTRELWGRMSPKNRQLLLNRSGVKAWPIPNRFEPPPKDSSSEQKEKEQKEKEQKKKRKATLSPETVKAKAEYDKAVEESI